VTSRPDVTIVVPTRDRRVLLTVAVTSALAQEDLGVEVLVMDDGSRDGTPDAMAELGDPRVRCVTSATARGASAARNAGIELARAPWVSFLDDDDFWAPAKLRRQLDAAAAADAGFAYSSALFVDGDARPLRVSAAPPPETLARELLSHHAIPAGASNVVARTDLLRAVGGFDPEFLTMEDWDLWLGLVERAAAAAVPEPLVAYRQVLPSKSRRNARLLQEHCRRLAERHRGVSERVGAPFDFSWVEEWAGRRARRADREAGRYHLAEGRNLAAARSFATSAVRNRQPSDLARAGAALLGRRAYEVLARQPVAEADAPTRPDEPDWVARYRELERRLLADETARRVPRTAREST
jgi:Glycosyl transferase family 2